MLKPQDDTVGDQHQGYSWSLRAPPRAHIQSRRQTVLTTKIEAMTGVAVAMLRCDDAVLRHERARSSLVTTAN